MGLVALLTAGVAAAEDEISPGDVKGPTTWGSVANVTHLRHLWFAGQPDRAGFEAAKAAGVELVINLRDPSELSWDERAAVEELEMAYYNVPVTGSAFDPVAFTRIEEILVENQGKPTLIHCASSNRVGGWLATHLVQKHGLSEEQAIAVGRQAGITKPAIEDRVRVYLSTSGP
jgi:protein tyrosine phosphatase (PTP) superfamily phosphohydrolase (DUF442 family)